jgi:uncharacterized protein (TIGR03382 family)
MIRHRLIGSIVFGFAMAATNAEAYCVVNGDMAKFWSISFPDLYIPVWVIHAGDNTVASTGVSPEDVARLTIEVIARHNESILAPKLYFAGFSDQAYLWTGNLVENLEMGISIMSMGCGDQHYDNCGKRTALACAGFGFGDEDHEESVGWVRILPPECSDATTWSLTEYNDMAQVIMHEIGHVLGLKHSSATQEECEAGGNIHVGDPAGSNGVMFGAAPGGFAAARSWRRDDIAALDHLYGPSAPGYELARWHDDQYPAYPPDQDATSFVGMPVTRGATVSNGADSNVQVLVTTGPEGRVLHQLVDSNGDLSPAIAEAPVDLSPAGLTWASPASATGEVAGERRVFVGWFANEVTQSTLANLRLATRAEDSLEWSYADHPEQHRVNRLALGFDAITQEVVMVTMQPTSELTVAVFDGEGQPVSELLVLQSLQAFDVGSPICSDRRCLIPYSQPAFGGPNFSVAEVEIDPEASTLNLLATEIHESVDTFGRLSLFEDVDGLWATTGERRFALGGYPGSSPDAAAFMLNPVGAWPLAALRGGGATPRLIQPRPVVCGNGILQGAELCDDGNLVDGDGCDLCGLGDGSDDEGGSDGDPGLTTEAGNSGQGADEVGGEASDASTEGCECSGSGGGPSSSLGLLALAVARRRRLPALKSQQ